MKKQFLNYNYLFNIVLVGEKVVSVLKQRFPSVVYGIYQHPHRIHITLRGEALFQDVFRCQKVKIRLTQKWLSCVVLLKLKGGLQ